MFQVSPKRKEKRKSLNHDVSNISKSFARRLLLEFTEDCFDGKLEHYTNVQVHEKAISNNPIIHNRSGVNPVRRSKVANLSDEFSSTQTIAFSQLPLCLLNKQSEGSEEEGFTWVFQIERPLRQHAENSNNLIRINC